MKKGIIIGLIVLLGMGLMGCQSNQDTENTMGKIVFTLDWFPNTNHTGVYVAKEKGYFEAQGLDVEIIQPGESTAEQLVASDSAQFGVSYQESVTFARSEGIPVVSIAAVIQHNTSGFMSLAEKGIESPKDFEGKKYGGWGSPIEIATLQYLMEQEGADINLVEVITVGDIDFFAASRSGDIDFAWVFEGWSVVDAELKGHDIHYIDLGKEAPIFDYYTPVIIASERMIAEKTELVERFMVALEQGYNDTIENPDEAAEILLKHVPELEEELVFASQAFLSERYLAEGPYWGYQSEETWERYTQWLYDNGFITNWVSTEEAFTNEFLNQ